MSIWRKEEEGRFHLLKHSSFPNYYTSLTNRKRSFRYYGYRPSLKSAKLSPRYACLKTSEVVNLFYLFSYVSPSWNSFMLSDKCLDVCSIENICGFSFLSWQKATNCPRFYFGITVTDWNFYNLTKDSKYFLYK